MATLHFNAMAIEVPVVPNHPNRVPFTGVLTRVDEASDHPPGGANGKCVLIPEAVAEAAIPSLLLMGVDCNPALTGHDRQAKIGTITEAFIDGRDLRIAGFFFGNDFPDLVAAIQRDKEKLGFSYECEEVYVQDWNADPVVVTSLVFTGAAVLHKADAAYESTSLAAQAEQKEKEQMEEMLKKMMEQFTALAASVEGIGKKVDGLEAKSLEAKGASVDAGAMLEKVRPHAEKLRACASTMEAAGIGTHPTQGHANVLRHMAACMEAEAVMGNLPHIYRDHDYLSRSMEASAKPGETPDLQKVFEGFSKELKDAVGAMGTKLTDLETRAFNASADPGRKTIPPEIAALLTKGGLNAEAQGKTMTVDQIDAALDAAGVKGRPAIEAKLKLMHGGALPVGETV